MDECNTYLARELSMRELDCDRLDTRWLILSHLSILERWSLYPTFRRSSRFQDHKQSANIGISGKRTEGKEVASYTSRTCTRSIGAVMGAETQSSSSDIQLGLQTSDLRKSNSAFSRSSLLPLDSSPSNTLPYSPYPLTFDPKSLIVYICVCLNAKNSPRR
jgi:hypothetical protein